MQSFNMYALVLCAFVLVSLGLAAPVDSNDAQILRYDNDNIGVDGYNFAYETSNGISQQEQGELINPGTDREALSVTGSYRYKGPDGNVYEVNYVADENGFQPQGAHLPVAPQ